MRFAINDFNERIEVSRSGEKAHCRGCGAVVIGRKGKIRKEHWYHPNKDCDSWYEPITDWHISWQNQFPVENIEIGIADSTGKIVHRADILLNNNLVIEIQNSPISIKDIEKRESFYGKNNMIWILNGSTLASNCHLDSIERTNVIAIYVDFYKGGLSRNFEKMMVNEELILPSCKYYVDRYNYEFHRHKFDFPLNINYQLLKMKIESFLKLKLSLYDGLYDEEDYAINSHVYNDRCLEAIELKKMNWRKFIDQMKFPVFFDNLNGLPLDRLYWYQENRIVKKERFLNKYLQYT
ncbi:MAG: hypothetical protein CL840_08945 [Crocinitomicaceae bacterium]|nr:hypothetical protein [Crocinitomicaceae bacterium]|tara:strand:- start:30262 stop:31143 length:882 start_codon:yes stop_codon:yes gene_type:complete